MHFNTILDSISAPGKECLHNMQQLINFSRVAPT